jgi:hypothetical protein
MVEAGSGGGGTKICTPPTKGLHHYAKVLDGQQTNFGFHFASGQPPSNGNIAQS